MIHNRQSAGPASNQARTSLSESTCGQSVSRRNQPPISPGTPNPSFLYPKYKNRSMENLTLHVQFPELPSWIAPPSVTWPPAQNISIAWLRDVHYQVLQLGKPNFLGARLPVHSGLNIPEWRSCLRGYPDYGVIEFLEFGWPVNYTSPYLPKTTNRNHASSLNFAEHIDKFICKEVTLGATAGPFSDNPLKLPIATSPLSSVPKKGKDERRMVMDLSFPHGTSVNDGIPHDTFLGQPSHLTYPNIDALSDIIRDLGPGCLLFKLDLRRAYRQLPVDPRDFHLLGFTWRGSLFIDTKLPFGLRSAAMACQRTTNAIIYIFQQLGFKAINFLDDFCGADLPHRAHSAFLAFRRLLVQLGVEEAVDKAVAPTTSLSFIGISVDTVTMTLRVTEDRLTEIKQLLVIWLDRKKCTRRELQVLIGKLSFVAGCVRPGRLFMSRMLATLRSVHSSRHHIFLNGQFRKDLQWWYLFICRYNGVSIIPDKAWSTADSIVATDACLSGCGGITHNQFFHCAFPDFIAAQHLGIHCLEALTIVAAARLWGNNWAGRRILVFCDNMDVVLVLNSGKARDSFLLTAARELWFLAALNEFELKAVHLRGSDNRLADCLSRWHLNRKHQLQLLQEDLRLTRLAAFRPGTRRNLVTQFHAFGLFCSHFDFKPLPASSETLSLYAQFLSRSFRNPASIGNYLAGVKTLHILLGHPVDSFLALDLKLTLAGLKKSSTHTPLQKLPITPAMLANILKLIDRSDTFYSAVWCAIITGFFTFLRKSNLVPLSQKGFDPSRHLCRKDIDVQRDFVMIAIRWSKTLQCHERILLLPLARISGSALCPVSAFKCLFSKVQAAGEAPAFTFLKKGKLVPLTQGMLSRAFSKLIQMLGEDPRLYSLHSLRRGGATLAFEAGVPTDLIKLHGDWRSEAYTSYIRVPLQARLSVSKCMAGLACTQLAQ
ncbi:uncharacterized protein LOC144452084 [Glandiceps talaboti]